jgi:nucleoside-diphosphate kinase
MQTTVGVIKPEGIQRELVKNILERLEKAGLVVTNSKTKTLTEKEVELLYGKVREPEWLHRARRKYLTTNKVILLKISGKDAVKKLLDLRGYSNPKNSAPGTIRGDFARDQDYVELRKQKKIALNMFHACDTEQEAKILIREFGL